MSIVAAFNVDGLPAPQGSHTAVMRGRRAFVIPVGARKLEAWRSAVRLEARTWMAAHNCEQSPWDRCTPLHVTILFRLPEPKVRPKRRLHERRPDVDKLARAVLDSLGPKKGGDGIGLIADDSRVAILVAIKTWAATNPSGAHITVRAANDTDIEKALACSPS